MVNAVEVIQAEKLGSEIDPMLFVGSLIAGSLGATMSVLMRMSGGKFDVTFGALGCAVSVDVLADQPPRPRRAGSGPQRATA